MLQRESHRKQPDNHSGTALVAALAILLATAGCDGLLDVDLPGQMEEEELGDPQLAETLVLGAQADFECGFTYFVWATGIHTDDLDAVSSWRNINIWGARLPAQRDFGASQCNPAAASVVAPWQPLQTARFQADQAIERIEAFSPEEIEADVDFLLGKAHVYAGYSEQLLSEAFCSVTFDVGPEETREDGFERARDRFTQALQRLVGINTAEAEDLRNAALVGRARANLNLDNRSEVAEDASQVPHDFVMHSTHSTTDSRRWNVVHRSSNIDRHVGMNRRFLNLEVDGVPDPRVPHGELDGVGSDGFSNYWPQEKYTSTSDDMPFATGREAALMIAEAEGGQTAVDVINELRADHGLPEFTSDDPLEIQAQVMDERRRELWLQGTRIGDLLRFDDEVLDARGLNWETGANNKGEAFGPNTCLPLMDAEVNNNPNL